jgi:hypothetical protein
MAIAVPWHETAMSLNLHLLAQARRRAGTKTRSSITILSSSCARSSRFFGEDAARNCGDARAT